MNILVIGSSGFIGRHCLEHFRDQHTVWHCDIYPPTGDHHYRQVDGSSEAFDSLFKERTYDYCINCAGSAAVSQSFISPDLDFKLNVTLVSHLLTGIKNHSPECHFINLSSAAVYGSPTRLPVSENSQLLPISPYGHHKLLAERVCEEHSNAYNLKTCSLRIFSAYGRFLKKQIFWDLHQKTQRCNRITLSGTGDETRDFIHISDLISQIELAMQHSHWNSDIINVANGKAVIIRDAVNTLIQIAEWNGQVDFSGSQLPGYPLHWQADISKMRSFGYTSATSLESGLTDYIKWFSNEPKK